VENGWRHDRAGRFFDVFIATLIIANVAATIVQTVPQIAERYGTLIDRFDAVCVAVFIVEYGLRLWTVSEHPVYGRLPALRGRLTFAATPLMILDLVAILPFFVALFFPVNLAAVRVLRLVRFFRLARYSPALGTIGRVIRAEGRALAACIVVLCSVLILASVAMYLAEGHVQPDKFGSVPAAMWWGVVTLSTVGYGDVVPSTPGGRLIGAIVMICGFGLFALPIGILASGFQQEIRRRDFVVTYTMVASVPLFANLDAHMLAEVMRSLNSRRMRPGEPIISEGETADAMYFIMEGKVEVELPEGPVTLSAGDFFGEMALLRHSRHSVGVKALEQCELLMLRAHDFRLLLARHHDFAVAIRTAAKKRATEKRGDLVMSKPGPS